MIQHNSVHSTGQVLSPPAGLVRGADRPLTRQLPSGPLDRAVSREVANLLDDVRSAFEFNPEAARAAALQLAAVLEPAVKVAAQLRGGLAPWQQRKIERYMQQHLENPVSVEQLAALLPLSVSHFCRAFKESFGMPPHLYLMHLRLGLAQHLMLTTEEPLSQIAVACGLSDQAHLAKLFRRMLAETPSSWRRRNMTDGPAPAARAARGGNRSGAMSPA